jgi:outer membrane protein TolC
MILKRTIYYLLWLPYILPVNNPLWGQSADSLNHYLEIAARNNPTVKADFLAYQASLQKLPQAGAYQDPQLEIGFFLKPMEIIDGRQAANFQLMQMFPWFGTRKAARTEATHMAKMAFERFRETRDNLYLNVYTQWFTLCRLQQKLINNKENKALLTHLEELAMRKFSSPASGADSGMPDVLRIQMEIAESDSNIESVLSEIAAEKAGFNALLNRPAESEIIVPDSFGQLSFLFDTTSIMKEITRQNPMLGMITEEELTYKA